MRGVAGLVLGSAAMIPIATGLILLGGGMTAFLLIRSAGIRATDFTNHVTVALETVRDSCAMCCIEALEAIGQDAPREAV